MKDIFIDNNVAKNFAYPSDPHYKELLQWLIKKHPKDEDNAYLVVSNKLLHEFYASNRGCFTNTSIGIIINTLTQQGRLIKIENHQIASFISTYFKKKITKKLLSNNEDRQHIPVVLLSMRKLAITIDKNFATDLTNFPGFTVITASRPEEVDYKGL